MAQNKNHTTKNVFARRLKRELKAKGVNAGLIAEAIFAAHAKTEVEPKLTRSFTNRFRAMLLGNRDAHGRSKVVTCMNAAGEMSVWSFDGYKSVTKRVALARAARAAKSGGNGRRV